MGKLFSIWLWAMLLVLCVGFSSCGGGSNSSSNSQEEVKEVKETEKIPPKVKETYNFINGKTFKSKVATQRTEYGAIDQYESLTFKPVTETEGDVYSVVEWEEWGLAGGNKGTVAKNSTSYYIREDGKIIFGSCILEKSGYSLKSNLKTNDGYNIIYR